MHIFSFRFVLNSIVTFVNKKHWVGPLCQALHAYDVSTLQYEYEQRQKRTRHGHWIDGLMDWLFNSSEPMEVLTKLLSWRKSGLSTREMWLNGHSHNHHHHRTNSRGRVDFHHNFDNSSLRTIESINIFDAAIIVTSAASGNIIRHHQKLKVGVYILVNLDYFNMTDPN